MKNVIGAVLALTVFCLAGCGSKSASSLGSSNAKLFAAAPASVKSQWDAASAAIATNGYTPAIVALKNLQQQSLSPEQLKAVNDTVTAVSDQMYAAANKGDAAAKQAIQDLRKAMGR
jgi:hypothetical protein